MDARSLTCPCGGFAMFLSTEPGRLERERAAFEAEHADCPKVIDVDSREVGTIELPAGS